MAETLTDFGFEQVSDYFVTKGNRVQLGGIVTQTGDDFYYYSEVKPATLNYTASSVSSIITLGSDVTFNVTIPSMAKAGASIEVAYVFILDNDVDFLGQFDGVANLPTASVSNNGATAYAVIGAATNDVTGNFYQVQNVSGTYQWVEVADDIHKMFKLDLENGATYSGNGEFTLTGIEITLS